MPIAIDIDFDTFVRSISEEFSSELYMTLVGLRRLPAQSRRHRTLMMREPSPCELTLLVDDEPFVHELDEPAVLQVNPRELYFSGWDEHKVRRHQYGSLDYGIISPKARSLRETMKQSRLLPSCAQTGFLSKTVSSEQLETMFAPFREISENDHENYNRRYAAASNTAYHQVLAMLGPLPFAQYKPVSASRIPEQHHLLVLSLLANP